MVLSMTGFGRAEEIFEGKKISIDLKSLNSKSLDLNIKIPLRYKEKEFEIRKKISDAILRGKIDCYISLEAIEINNQLKINEEVVKSYMDQLRNCANDGPDFEYLKMAIRLPEATNSPNEELSDDETVFLFQTLEESIEKMISFRKTEGEILGKELEKNIQEITDLLSQVSDFEEERVTNLKERYQTALKDFDTIDETRFYQEIAYFIEKLDISEEKVRLKQHLNYYLEVLHNEDFNGKKLGFISQEIGREINTLGSKANHHEIQKIVVMMKDNLEKIKEQTLNIL